jgi:hypothetical protein
MKDIESLTEIDYPKMLALKVRVPPRRSSATTRPPRRPSTTRRPKSRNCSPSCATTTRYSPRHQGQDQRLGSGGRARGERPRQGHPQEPEGETFPLPARESGAEDQEGHSGEGGGDLGRVRGLPAPDCRGCARQLLRQNLIFICLAIANEWGRGRGDYNSICRRRRATRSTRSS